MIRVSQERKGVNPLGLDFVLAAFVHESPPSTVSSFSHRGKPIVIWKGKTESVRGGRLALEIDEEPGALRGNKSEPLGKRVSAIVDWSYHPLTILVDISPLGPFPNRGQALREGMPERKSRLDHKLSMAVNVTEISIDQNSRKSLGELPGPLEGRGYCKVPVQVDITAFAINLDLPQAF